MSTLDQLVKAVRQSSKYRYITEAFVRRVGQLELNKRRNLKAAIKATKNKLHQVAGAYVSTKMPYEQWLDDLRQTHDLGTRCREIMQAHASTRERLPILDEFYDRVLSDLGPIHSVIDVACGLNPLAIPWMPLAPNARYYAYDIYDDLVKFVHNFLKIVKIDGYAQAYDITQTVPPQTAEVGLILKTLPVLEQVGKGTTLGLLEDLKVQHIVVSFPVTSLTGKHMVTNYEARLRGLLVGKKWVIRRYEFDAELVFRLSQL